MIRLNGSKMSVKQKILTAAEANPGACKAQIANMVGCNPAYVTKITTDAGIKLPDGRLAGSPQTAARLRAQAAGLIRRAEKLERGAK